ncbi:MAG: polysaccharide deacetylase family protein, partial [Gammaproteobacteria bacterium]
RFALELPGGKTEQFDLDTQDAGRLASALRDRLKTLPQDALYPWLSRLYAAAAVDEPSEPPPDMQPMSWPEARRFIAMGHAIAPHTRTHRILSQLSDAASHAEISDSAARVLTETEKRSAIFAYPTGRLQDFGAREMSVLGEQGIGCAVSTDPRAVLGGDRIHALPRYSLPDTVEDFAQYLGFFEVLKARLRAQR